MSATFRYDPLAHGTFRCLEDPIPNKGPVALVIAYQGGSRTFTRTLTLKKEEQEKVDQLFQALRVEQDSNGKTCSIDLKSDWIQGLEGGMKSVQELAPAHRKIIGQIRDIFDAALKADGRDSLTQTLPSPFADRSGRIQALLQKGNEHVQVALENLPEDERKKRMGQVRLLEKVLDGVTKSSEQIEDKQFASQIKRLDPFAMFYALATLPSAKEEENLDELQERLTREMERFEDLVAKQEPGRDAAPKSDFVSGLLHPLTVGSRDPELTEGEHNYIKDVILLSVSDQERYLIGQKMSRLTSSQPLEQALLQCALGSSPEPLMNHPSVKALSADDRSKILKQIIAVLEPARGA